MNTEKREKKRICVIIGCKSTSTDHNGIRFFRFPAKGTKQFELWLSKCEASYNSIISFNHPLICSLHFKPNVIGKQRLHLKAYPSLNLSIPPKCFVEADLKSKMKFMDKVVREWIARSRRHQNISAKTVSSASRDVREILNIPRHIPNPQWMKDFDYLPILAKEDGTILKSQRYSRSQIVDIMRDLKRGDQCADKKPQSEDDNSASNHETLHKKTDTEENDDEDSTTARSEGDDDQAAEIETNNNSEDEGSNLSDQTETNIKTIDSYVDALEHLRPLEHYVEQRKVLSPLISLIAQLKENIKDQISHDEGLSDSE